MTYRTLPALMLLTVGGCDSISCAVSGPKAIIKRVTQGPEDDPAPKDEQAVVDVDASPPEAEVVVGAPEQRSIADAVRDVTAMSKPEPAPHEAFATVEHVKVFTEVSWGGDARLGVQLDVEAKNPRRRDDIYVHVKATCLDGERYFVSSNRTSLDSLRSLGITLFTEASPALDECTVELALAGSEGAVSVPLGAYCFSMGETTVGRCFDSPAQSTSAQTIRVDDIEPDFDDGLALAYHGLLDADIGDEAELEVIAVCRVDGLNLVERDSDSFDAGAFEFVAGESLVHRVELFQDDNVFDDGFDERTCELRFGAVSEVMFGDEAFHHLHTACLEGGRVKDGACEDFAATIPRADEAGFALSNLTTTMTVPLWGGRPGDNTVRMSGDVTLSKPIEAVPGLFGRLSSVSMRGNIRCAVGRETFNESSIILTADLSRLEPGESLRFSVDAFWSDALKGKPSWCQMDIENFSTEEPMFSACYKGGNTRAGKC